MKSPQDIKESVFIVKEVLSKNTSEEHLRMKLKDEEANI